MPPSIRVIKIVGKLAVIRTAVSEADAMRLVAALSDSSNVQVETTRYFPYFSFAGRCTLPGLFGKRHSNVRCLIDAVNGHGATADRFDVDDEDLADSSKIAVKLTEAEATAAAQRIVTHSLGRNLRVIAQFEPDFDAAKLVYKKFWIVGDGQIKALVDSADGSMHPLRVRAA